MLLGPKDFTVLIKRGDGEDPDLDFDWEFDDEGDSVSTDEPPPTDEDDGLFSSIISAVVEDEISAAADASLLLIEAAVAFNRRAGHTASDDPYTPHPAAAALDTVITYDASDINIQCQHNRDRNRVAATSRAIASQMRRVLTARSQSRVQRDQHRGKLDRRKLAGLNLPGRLHPDKGIFQRLAPGKTSKVAIGILVDQSGSMSVKGKMTCAREAATALGGALALLAPLGVKFAVWGFDTNAGQCVAAKNKAETRYDRIEPLRMHVYKMFADDWRRVSPRCGAMRARQNNCDGEAIRWAAHQLLATENVDRRVLIVLSDGLPACNTARDTLGGPHDGQARMTADAALAVKQVIDLGIETLGIGICSSAVKDFYPSHIVINDPAELESVLMEGLKATLGTAHSKVAA